MINPTFFSQNNSPQDPLLINEYIKRKIMDKKVACKSSNSNDKN